jgi:uncharacterized protein (TIGR02687 family)
MTTIEEGLLRLFEKHRIVIWYDALGEFAQDYEEVVLPNVLKCHISNNEFALKHRVLLAEPNSKFLLYGKFEQPNPDDNWLLDIELSNTVFHTDQESLTLQELGLPVHFKLWVRKHIQFFKSKERKTRFASNIKSKDNEDDLTRALIQTVVGSSSSNLDEIVKSYATAFINDKSEAIDKELSHFSLADYLWSWIESFYRYSSNDRTIYGFILDVFQKNFSPTSKESTLNSSADVLLSSWKDARSFELIYQELVKKVESSLDIASKVENCDIHELLCDDVFESIDRRIIQDLAYQLEQENISSEKIDSIIKQRESCYWYAKYSDLYNAIKHANWLFKDIAKYNNVKFVDYHDGFTQYTDKLYLIDQHYRKFIQYYRQSSQNSVLSSIYKKVHKSYSNTWLLKLSDAWQEVIDRNDDWYFGNKSQHGFFKHIVQEKYIDKNITLFVIISDALRFECGQELHDLFSREPRYSSTLEYLITGLPSYTQLGMAALLPHNNLEFGNNDSILIDSKNSIGIQAREKVLIEGSGVQTTTILAEDLMKMPSKSDEARRLVQDHQLVYVYHNRIDKTGDDKTSEDKVIEASKDEIVFLLDVTKKITNMNGNHVVITADHGFIYQNEPLEESDFSDSQISGDIFKENRRYVIGKNLQNSNNVMKFSAQSLKINSDVDILIPKGINRLRKQGSGSRYVHGGATLQEVVTPLLYVAKKRTDTVSKVGVDVLKGSNRITTNLQRVKFFQESPIGEKKIARSVKSYFCSIEGEQKKIISDIFSYTFDSESKRAQDREVEYNFTISTELRRSSTVYLIVEEQIDQSNKWKSLLEIPYTLILAMENDFDDF